MSGIIRNNLTGRNVKLLIKGNINPTITKGLKKDINAFSVPKGYFVDRKEKKMYKIKEKVAGKKKKKVFSKFFIDTVNDDPSRVKLSQNLVLDQFDKKIYDRNKVMTPEGKLLDFPSFFNKRLTQYKSILLPKNPLVDKYDVKGKVNNKQTRKIGGVPMTTKNIFSMDEPSDSIQEFIDIIKYEDLDNFSYEERNRPINKLLIRFFDDEFTNWNYRFFDLDDIDDLESQIDDRGLTYGSDADIVSMGYLDMTWFQISHSKIIPTGNENLYTTNSIYWVCKQPKTINNCCFDGAVRKSLKLSYTYRNLREKMIHFTKDYDYPIKEGEGINFIQIGYYEEFLNCKIDIFEDKPHYSLDEETPNRIYKSQKEEGDYISILFKDNHYSLILKPKLKIKELTSDIKKANGLTEKKKIQKFISQNHKGKKKLLLIFDIETIFDRYEYDFLKPYGVSWVVWDDEKPFNYNPNIHLNKPYCWYEKGKNCLREFIHFATNPPEGCVYVPIGFNNSKFDNILVCAEARRMGLIRSIFFVGNSILTHELEDTCKSWDACRFLVGSLDSCCKAYKTNPRKEKDLIDHYEVQCYWEDKGWKGLEKLLEDKPDLVKYNKLDCLCLLDLVLKMRKSYLEMFDEDVFNSLTISSYGYKILNETWSGLKQFKDDLNGMEKEKAKDMIENFKPRFNIIKAYDFKDDAFHRSSLTAGRVQTFYDRIKIEMPMAMADVKSLYPTVMGNYGGNNCPYPYGHYKITDKYIKGKLGIYKVNVKHQRAKWKNNKVINSQFKLLKKKYGVDLYKEYAPNVIPLREQDCPLNWYYQKELKEIALTSVDIEVLRWATEDEDCVEVLNGHYWEESRTDLFFEFLDKPKKEKTKQDWNKVNDPDNYNVAKREGGKMISNSQSGKLLEAIHEDDSCEFSTQKYLDWCKDKDVKEIEINDFGGGFTTMTGKKSAESVYNKMKIDKRKPAYLGMFIYSYARQLMYKEILSKYITLYMDTDSACMPLIEWDRMNNENGRELIENGEYGCLEEEVCDLRKCDKHKNLTIEEDIEFRKLRMVDGVRCKDCKCFPATKLYSISPKNYAVINPYNEEFSKRKFKGVRKTDKWRPLRDFGDYAYNCKGKIFGSAVDNIRGNFKNGIVPLSQSKIRRLRETHICEKCVDDRFSGKEECIECKNNSLKNYKAYSNEMFEALVEGEKIAILCSMILRKKMIVGPKKDWSKGYKYSHNPTILDLEDEFKNKSNQGKESFKLKLKSPKQKSKEINLYKENHSSIFITNKKQFWKNFYDQYEKYEDIENETELKEVFVMKQQYMIKIL